MMFDDAQRYFEFLANLGLTKHIGAMDATRQLIDLCQIRPGDHVLDVGCGVGATPSHLARALGCRVVGVDLLEDMIHQSRQRARADRIQDRVAFAVADARCLPFPDGAFDAVIMESLNVFFEDKQSALREYVRVTRPGGYVGITEMTWLSPPSLQTAAYYRRVVFAEALQAEGWIELLEQVGLEDVVGNAQPVDLPRESKGRIERYGCRGMLRVLWNTLRALVQDPTSRAFLKDVTQSLPRDMLKDMGYGVYAGRKP
jgi:ubiquinone/menaquinone biosynthesis C-methylase UbiE